MPTPVLVNSRTPIAVQADRMGAIDDRLAELNKQISTGERISRPSDDPAAANRVALLGRLQDRMASEQRSIDRASSRLALAETATVSAGDALVRARELALLAANGTASAEDRQVMLREVEVLQGQLLSAANAQDEAGRYIFAGAASYLPAYALQPGAPANWQGIDESAGAEAAGIEGVSPPRGPSLFGSDVDGAFAALQRLADGLSEVDPEIRRGQLDVALAGLEAGYNRLLDGQARIGAGRARLEAESKRLDEAGLYTNEAIANANGVDMLSAIAELETLKLSLSASQGAFTRVFDGTLFDRLG